MTQSVTDQVTIEDPILFQTILNNLTIVVEEMALAISNSAYSALISGTSHRTGDCDAAILLGNGELLATDERSIVHMASLPTGLKFVLKEFPLEDVKAGDVFINNDPHQGAIHSNDTMVFKPVFIDGIIRFWAAVMAHVTDLGGMSPGGISVGATSIFAEGLVIPPSKLYDQGIENTSLIRMISANSRQPKETTGDVLALVAGANVGFRGIQDLLQRRGSSTVMRVCEEILDYSERLTRRRIAELSDGRYTGQCAIDDDGLDLDRHYTVVASVDVDGDSMKIDLSGTSDQARGSINSSFSQSLTAVTYAVRAYLGSDIPLNEGFWRPLTWYLPLGSVVNPRFPAACNTRMANTTPSIVEAVMWALRPVAATRSVIHVAGSGVPDVHAMNPAAEGEYWLHFEAEWGGTGGRSNKDGVDGGGTPMLGGSGGMIPVELSEAMYDLRCERFALRRDTGGAGKFRGGLGLEKVYRFLRPCVLSARTDRWVFPPAGLDGGSAGAPGGYVLNPGTEGEQQLPSKFAEMIVDAGDVVSFCTTGGGGFGDPFEREPARVLADISSGKVSRASAQEQYGVVTVSRNVDGETVLAIDDVATAEARNGRR
jgi:N-methylhydantoinase B